MELKLLSKLLKGKEHIVNYVRNSQIKIVKNLNFKKIAGINFTFFVMNYFLLQKDYLISNNKLFSKNEFVFLLTFNPKEMTKFTGKKCPKILYLSGQNETENEKNKIEGNFSKIHSKYKELESFQFDIKKSLNSIYELDQLLKHFGYSVKDLISEDIQTTDENLPKIKEEILKKPFLFLNKYGDVRNYTLDQFSEIAKSDSAFNYFEKLSILNNKHDLLLLNDYDYAFVAYLDSKNLDYSNPIFKAFRRMHFTVNFFNIKFFVATPEHSEFLNKMNLKMNNVYLIKRDNMLNDSVETETIKFDLEHENFEFVNLTNELIKIPSSFKTEDDEFSMNLNKLLMNKANFVYYANHSFKMKQGLEIFNLYFKDVPYYLYFTNLKVESNREKLNIIIEIFKENLDNINKNFAFVVVDNEKTKKNALFKSFKEKTFNLTEHTLKNTKFEETIPHYEASVTKKLKLKELTKEKIIELIKKEDITLQENYVFTKKILPENFKMINYMLFDYLINPNDLKSKNKAKVILIRNKDEKYNRDSMKRMESLAKLNQDIEFFYMYNTDKNLELLNNKFGALFGGIKNYPQVLILKEDKVNLFPINLILKYSAKEDLINEELKKSLI